MLPRSDYTDYYGLRLYYRFENRKSGRAIRLSLYDVLPDLKQAKKLCTRVYTVPEAARDGDREIAEQLAPRLLRSAFPAPGIQEISEQQMKLRESCFPHFSLAVIAVCDTEAMIQLGGWSESYANEYRLAMKYAIDRFGCNLLKDLKPADVSEALLKESPRKAEAVIRALQKLVHFENAWGCRWDNPWDDYLLITQRNRKTPKTSGRKNAEILTLSTGELHRTLSRLLNLIKRSSDPRLFAFLLYLTTPLSLEEICALQCGDFVRLKEYTDCLVVRITKEYVKKPGAKRSAQSTITNPYRRRWYPLPALIRQAFAELGELNPALPLIHHPQNRERYFIAGEFRKFIRDEIIGEGKGYDALCPFLAENKDRLEEIAKGTVRNLLSTCGIEEDELTYLYGRKPKSTSGYYYCDFGAEGEMNRLSLLQDRWLGAVGEYNDLTADDMSMRSGNGNPSEFSFSRQGDSLRLHAKTRNAAFGHNQLSDKTERARR